MRRPPGKTLSKGSLALCLLKADVLRNIGLHSQSHEPFEGTCSVCVCVCVIFHPVAMAAGYSELSLQGHFHVAKAN